MSEAFGDAVVALVPMLRAFAARLTHSRPEAEDLVQETLSRAWRYRYSFQADTNLKSWLCKILQNCFYKDADRQRLTVQDVDGHWAALQSVGPSQEWYVRYSEVMSALEQLTPDTRDALMMVVADGLSYAEVAQASDCPVGTVKSRVSRARERLSELTGDPGVSPPGDLCVA